MMSISGRPCTDPITLPRPYPLTALRAISGAVVSCRKRSNFSMSALHPRAAPALAGRRFR
jgi:hypothetical protein